MSSETKTWFIECGAYLPNNFFTRNHMMRTEKVIDFRLKYSNKGVFATAYMYDSENQADANLYGDFYLDFDHELDESENPEQAFGLIRKEVLGAIQYFKIIYDVNPADIEIFFSGSKGMHVIVPKEAFGIEPHKHLNMVFRMMAEDLVKLKHLTTVDLRIYDNKRLFRLPNSIHQKTNLYKVQISYEELSSLSYEQMKVLAKTSRPLVKAPRRHITRASMEFKSYLKKLELLLNKPRSNAPDMKLDFVPPCVDYLFKNRVGKGQRNDTLAFLASFCRQSGMTQEQAEQKLDQWNNALCEPSIPEREVVTTVDSIYKGNGKMGCARARTLSACDEKNCKLHRKGI